MPRPLLFAALLLALLGNLVQAQPASPHPVPEHHLLASPMWVQEHLSDPALVLVHVGRSPAGYRRGHLPGARFLPLSVVAVSKNGLPNEMPPARTITAGLVPLGIGPESRVVLYDEGAGMAAARAFVALDYLGLGDQAALLDGQLRGWKAANRPLSTEVPVGKPTLVKTRVQPGVLVLGDAVADVSWQITSGTAGTAALVDARSPGQFSGNEPGPGGTAGHIPGATSATWDANLKKPNQPFLKTPAALREAHALAGLDASAPLVTYCNSGMKASFSYYVLRYLGYSPALYDGSMADWAKRPGAPVVGDGR